MYKFVLSAIFCVALSVPTVAMGQDCGCCDTTPQCTPTRKRLALVDVTKEVCRLKVACVTDECGCTKRQLVRTKECVTRKRLALVDVAVDPCKPNCLDRLRGGVASLRARLQSKGCCDPCAPAPAPAAPCGCGCN